MDKDTFAALQNLMAYLKRLGVDDDRFDDFMALVDWMREHTPHHATRY